MTHRGPFQPLPFCDSVYFTSLKPVGQKEGQHVGRPSSPSRQLGCEKPCGMAPSHVWQPCHIAGVTSLPWRSGGILPLTLSTLRGHLPHSLGGCGGQSKTGLALLGGPRCAGTPGQVTEERETKTPVACLAES